MIDLTNIPRWITLSIQKYVNDSRHDIPMYVEGQQRSTNEQASYIELRIDGPTSCIIGSAIDYKFSVGVNVLVSITYDEKDTLKIQNICGIIAQVLQQDICVFKYGPTADLDNKDYVGTLQSSKEDKDVAINYFGQLEPTSLKYDATVEAHYEMYL